MAARSIESKSVIGLFICNICENPKEQLNRCLFFLCIKLLHNIWIFSSNDELICSQLIDTLSNFQPHVSLVSINQTNNFQPSMTNFDDIKSVY